MITKTRIRNSSGTRPLKRTMPARGNGCFPAVLLLHLSAWKHAGAIYITGRGLMLLSTTSIYGKRVPLHDLERAVFAINISISSDLRLGAGTQTPCYAQGRIHARHRAKAPSYGEIRALESCILIILDDGMHKASVEPNDRDPRLVIAAPIDPLRWRRMTAVPRRSPV